jgi:hypothetical protein
MTHPNIFVLGEIIKPLEGGGSQLVHQACDIDKEVRAAFVALANGVVFWSRYFSTESDFDRPQDKVKQISAQFEAASDLFAEEAPENGD